MVSGLGVFFELAALIALLVAFVGMAFAGERGDTAGFALYGAVTAVLWGVAWHFASTKGAKREETMKQENRVLLRVPEYRMSRWTLALYALVFSAAIGGIFATGGPGAVWAGCAALWVVLCALTEYTSNQRAKIAYMRGVVDVTRAANEIVLDTALKTALDDVTQRESTKQPN